MIRKLKTKVLLPGDLCNIDAIKYVANRYGTTPEGVLTHYLVQTGVVSPDEDYKEDSYELMTNEIALLRDLGAQPSAIEIQ